MQTARAIVSRQLASLKAGEYQVSYPNDWIVGLMQRRPLVGATLKARIDHAVDMLKQSNVPLVPNGPGDLAREHAALVHPNGERCPDGCGGW